jgi:hypothetical protein
VTVVRRLPTGDHGILLFLVARARVNDRNQTARARQSAVPLSCGELRLARRAILPFGRLGDFRPLLGRSINNKTTRRWSCSVLTWPRAGSTGAATQGDCAPPFQVYRQRGHRRLTSQRVELACRSCIWGGRMPVLLIIDQWRPENRGSRVETFCYGPKLIRARVYSGRASSTTCPDVQ